MCLSKPLPIFAKLLERLDRLDVKKREGNVIAGPQSVSEVKVRGEEGTRTQVTD